MSTQSNTTPDEQHFPYRTAGREVLNAAMVGVQDLVIDMARSMNHWNLDDHTLDDMIQDCMIHLWSNSLPSYDKRKGTKVSTYLHTCSFNYFRCYMPRVAKRKAKRNDMECLRPTEALTEYTASDERHGDRIQEIAADILAHPENYMTPAMSEAMIAVVNHPHLSKTEIAKMLGYAHPESLFQLLKRIRNVITDIDIEDYEVRP